MLSEKITEAFEKPRAQPVFAVAAVEEFTGYDAGFAAGHYEEPRPAGLTFGSVKFGEDVEGEGEQIEGGFLECFVMSPKRYERCGRGWEVQ